jgi:AraC-like DNA-binding protein
MACLGLYAIPSDYRAMLISPVNLKILAYTLDIEGFDSAAVLRQCGIESPDELLEDGDWLPVEMFDRMMVAAIEATGDPSFGLVAGKSIALVRYGVIASVVMPSISLRQILEDILRFAPLSVQRSEIELEESGQAARLLLQPLVQAGPGGRFRAEFVATTAIQMLRFTGAGNDDILQVDFPYARPDGQDQRYAVAFGANIHFDRKVGAVSFNPALLDKKLAFHDPVAYLAARTRAEAMLAAMQAGIDLAERVRQWLLRSLPALPTVAETAQHLGVNERTLRRQLSALNTSHADLAQECQRLMAERLLAEGQMPLKRVAELLGFSSVHSFHRAFRRWSGLTPSEWRDSRGVAPDSAPA